MFSVCVPPYSETIREFAGAGSLRDWVSRWHLAGLHGRRPLPLRLSRLYRWLRSKPRGPPLFEPPLKVERDTGHIENSGSVPQVREPSTRGGL
jgi:hypothetical protein